MAAVLIHPFRYLSQLLQPGFTYPVPALLPDGDEAAIGQDLYMQRYGLPAHIKLFGNSVHIMRLRGYHINNGAAGWVGYGLVNITSGFHNCASNCLQI